jgi:hypothetical protein
MGVGMGEGMGGKRGRDGRRMRVEGMKWEMEWGERGWKGIKNRLDGGFNAILLRAHKKYNDIKSTSTSHTHTFHTSTHQKIPRQQLIKNTP